MICRKHFVLSVVALLVIGISSGKARSWGTYYVSLQVRNIYVCSGALISDRHVLTAAQCLFYNDGRSRKEELRIVTYGDLRDDGSDVYTAEFVQIHPYFCKGHDKERPRNDIAVITLKPRVPEGSTAKPIRLPSNNHIDSKQWAHFVTEKKLDLHIGNRRFCERTHHKYYIKNSQLCTENTTSIFERDIGGPLEYRSTIVGILSYCIGSCFDGEPAVYTRVASYGKFIKDAMEEHN